MNFKRKIMTLSLLGLCVSSILGSDALTQSVTENLAPIADIAVNEGCRQVPYWFAYPYFFGEDFVKIGGKACGHMGSALGYMGNALGESWEATKGVGDFVYEYPKGSATIAAVIALIWLYSNMGNAPAQAGRNQGQPQGRNYYNFLSFLNWQ